MWGLGWLCQIMPLGGALVCYLHSKIKLVQAILNNAPRPPPPQKKTIKSLFGGTVSSIFAIFSSRLGLDKQKNSGKNFEQAVSFDMLTGQFRPLSTDLYGF